MSKLKSTTGFVDPDRGKLLSVRFLIALLLIVVGIAWIVYYYYSVRADPTDFTDKPGNPAFMADLKNWNYLIGFGAIMLGLLVAAHHDTPLGRNRGVVITMLGCFLFGLIWICTYYVISGDQLASVPIFNDLGQYNLLVGIAMMAVGFSYATRWE